MKGDPSNRESQFPGQDTRPPNRPHVLLVEDDDVMREMLAEALRRNGYKVTECADALKWLEICTKRASSSPQVKHQESYDVVVSDIRMPNINGLDVLRIIRSVDIDGSCPPTVFITAFGDATVHQNANDLGAVAVLDKPFPIKDLIDQVRALVAP